MRIYGSRLENGHRFVSFVLQQPIIFNSYSSLFIRSFFCASTDRIFRSPFLPSSYFCTIVYRPVRPVTQKPPILHIWLWHLWETQFVWTGETEMMNGPSHRGERISSAGCSWVLRSVRPTSTWISHSTYYFSANGNMTCALPQVEPPEMFAIFYCFSFFLSFFLFGSWIHVGNEANEISARGPPHDVSLTLEKCPTPAHGVPAKRSRN